MSKSVPDHEGPRTPRRLNGYAPIQDYAAIGNKRTAALVALDGAIDWLCLPRFDSPSVFGALLDPRLGGSFTLCPAIPFEARRRYAGDTNVLETTFETAEGSVRVTDLMSLGGARPVAWNELVRRVEGLAGDVPLRWRAEPRFDWRGAPPEIERAGDALLMLHDSLVLSLQCFDVGEPEVRDGGIEGEMRLRDGDQAMLVLSAFDEKPVLLPEREALDRRERATRDHWERWSEDAAYDGDWRDAVVRSVLALELMVHEPDGSMIAAVSSSLPEKIGGRRNYDYRYVWVRDTTFAMDALLRLGYPDAVHATLGWLLHTARATHPRVHTFYGLDGRVQDTSRELPDWAGYRGSKPVLVGNDAGPQLQLGNFGDLLHTTWLFVTDDNTLDPGTGAQLADSVDLLAEIWRNADSCIWELNEQRDYTQSKMSSWLAFERALDLAARGEMPDAHVDRWRRERDELRRFIDNDCFDPRRNVWKRDAHSDELDAAVLLIAGMNYVPPDDPRLRATIDAVRAELGDGPLLYRYSGQRGEEGCFLACSFWLAEALARTNRLDEAHELMDELVPLANDVGLYSEEYDPDTGDMLGNFPQALTHLSLINAAFAYREGRVREEDGELRRPTE
ncbi:MAG: glycoside hydrolase family 15 protein [Thermoleophilaceae bacterium]